MRTQRKRTPQASRLTGRGVIIYSRPAVAHVDRISEIYRGDWATPKTQQRERARIDWLVGSARGEVLDLGCSQGIAAILCARRGLRTVGVDRDESLIATAHADRERKPASVRELVAFEPGDAARLRFSDDSFDTVLIGELLQHAEDLEEVLGEAVRVVRPDGIVAITTPFGFDPSRKAGRSFYLASLVDALAPWLSIASVEIESGYFRVAAAPGAMSEQARASLIVGLQPRLEEVLTELDEEAFLIRGRRRRLAHAVRHLDRSSRRARWRLATIRATRWWRLGKALSRVVPAAMLRGPRRPPAKEPLDRWRERPRSKRRTAHAELTAPVEQALSVELPSLELPQGPVARPQLNVAVILDRFSATALRYEWNQVQFGPDDWRETLEAEPPDLLFVESAWRGNDGRWHDLLKGRSAARQGPVVDLVEWCRGRGIPTVFWNKEDPPNFGHFVYTAELFDHVFTVDGDCIPRYAEVLGREDVGVLQFGAQPRIHNPISVPGGRAHDVVFAGTYFPRKHPGRRRQMEKVLAPAREFGLHIYSRIVPGSDERFDWPPAYRPYVVGSLPYERMLAAYKAYKVFLNINSVTDSPTMCARRVFELSACSTSVLSGYSRAIGEVFGDLVPVTRSAEETRSKLGELLADVDGRERRAHEALRTVFGAHTYGHRVDEVLGAVGIATPDRARSVSVLMRIRSADEIAHAAAQVARQAGQPLQLVLVVNAPQLNPDSVAAAGRAAGIDDVVAVAAAPALAPGACLNLALDAAGGDLIAVLDSDATYEEHFLGDLAYAFSYTEAAVVGKRAHYADDGSGEVKLRFADGEHTYTEELQPGTLLVNGELLRRLRFDEASTEPEAELLRRCVEDGARLYAADRFSFVAGRRQRSRAPV
jgi:SAM-dependent methyltransferase/spore maturation protein CgeB